MLDKAEIAAKILQAEDKAEMIAILEVSKKVDKREIRDVAVEGGALLPWSDEKVRELYDAGYSDRQLANAFGFSENIIAHWREGNHMGPKRNEIRLGHRQGKIDSEKAMEFYKQGLSDTAIGKEFGAKATSVLQWRRKHGLPSNYMPAPKGKTEPAEASEGQKAATADEVHGESEAAETPKCEHAPTAEYSEHPSQAVSKPVPATEETGAEGTPANGAGAKISAASIIMMAADETEPGGNNSPIEGVPDTEHEFVIPILQIPRMARGGMVGMDGCQSRIKELREAKHLSQLDLAKDLEISQSALGNYERGDRIPDADLLIKLAQYFNVSTDYLTGLSNFPYGAGKHEAEFGMDLCTCCHAQLPIDGPMRIELLAVIGDEKYPVCPVCGLALVWASRKLQEQEAQKAIGAPEPEEAKP